MYYVWGKVSVALRPTFLKLKVYFTQNQYNGLKMPKLCKCPLPKPPRVVDQGGEGAFGILILGKYKKKYAASPLLP